MLSLSQTTGYAIRALGCLDGAAGEWMLSQQINAETGIPMPYLRKILNTLRKSGLVRAKRSFQGGFQLARPSDRITLMDVVKAVEGRRPKSHCLLGLAACSKENLCPVHVSWQAAKNDIEAQLESVTVEDMAGCTWTLPRQKG